MNTFRAIKFLFMAPVILTVLVIVNLMTWNGEWWVQWAALGIGIAWVVNLFRVVRAVLVAGGFAAVGTMLSAYLVSRQQR